MPAKPTKRGIKIWERYDARTGYTYDFDIYSGKDALCDVSRTLGESVVLKLCRTVRDCNISLCFDQFFTSTRLVNTIPFPAVETCISTRKNVPKFQKKKKKTSNFCKNQSGTTWVSWQDTKEVIELSNCHGNKEQLTLRKGKDGVRNMVFCPEAIAYYNRYMGGVGSKVDKGPPEGLRRINFFFLYIFAFFLALIYYPITFSAFRIKKQIKW